MEIIQVPNSRVWWPASGEIGLEGGVFASESPVDLTVQTVDMLSARWVGTITLTAHRNDVRASVEALFARLRGQANRLSMGHPARFAPRGTLRGSPTLGTSHAALASVLNISGTGTLLAGDLLGVGGQLVMVASDPVSLSSVPITPPLRESHDSGDPVVWDWPRAVFRVTNFVRIPYGPVASPGFSFDIVEDPQ